MDNLDPVGSPHAAPPSVKPQAKDPVCGMDVSPITARHKTLHKEKEYFFCSAGCLSKFQANPEKILSSPPKPMTMAATTSGLVSLGGPALVMPALSNPATPPIAKLAGGSGKHAQAYVCPMCPEVRQSAPGPCPKCGMALDPESPAIPASKTEYTCPMHPEIVRAEPGHCPICGMALEPRTVTVKEEDNPELRDMTRRFWISVLLTVPLLAIAMGSMLWPHALMGLGYVFYVYVSGGNVRLITSNSVLPWFELLLATPVVLWGGWPFFQRGW